MESFDVVVIGGGPAGMAAALGAAECSILKEYDEAQSISPPRDGRSEFTSQAPKVALVERALMLGGILNQCTHYGFGLTYFGEELTGQEYAKRFIDKVSASDIRILTDTTVMEINPDRTLTITGVDGGFRKIKANAVILATGCRERPIGALPVAGSRPSGVFTAGAAQKMLNLGGYDIGDKFVILGSGDVGLIVARELAQRGKEVITVIEREAFCGGLERNRMNCLERYGISLNTLTTVSKVHGSSRITGVTVVDMTGNENHIECDALITSVGLIPERELLDTFTTPLIERETTVAAPRSSRLLPDWLFLCGNAAYVHDLVDDVTIESEQAGRMACAFSMASRFDSTLHAISYSMSSMDHTPLLGAGGMPLGSVECNSDNHMYAADMSASRDSSRAQIGATPLTSKVVCIACPKECEAHITDKGWVGLACGRKVPVVVEQTN